MSKLGVEGFIFIENKGLPPREGSMAKAQGPGPDAGSESFVLYEYKPFHPEFVHLDGPRFCVIMVFTIVGACWTFVFSRCPIRWANPCFAAAVFCVTSATSIFISPYKVAVRFCDGLFLR